MSTPAITKEILLEWLDYNHASGGFTWKQKPNRHIRVGTIAGVQTPNGYWRLFLKGKSMLAHRAAWLAVHGKWPTHETDHINGNRIDNRIANLREATSAENKQNVARTNKSGFCGVAACGLGYRAKIRAAGTIHYLGFFKSPELASMAYLAAKRELHTFQPTLRKGVR